MSPAAGSDAPRWRVSSDWVLRFETADRFGRVPDTASRFRMRGQVLAAYAYRPHVDFGIGFLTGDPRAPQEAFHRYADFFARRDFALDELWVAYRPNGRSAFELGRVANPFLRSELVWDADVAFDGLTAVWASVDGRSRLVAGEYLVSEREVTENVHSMPAIQLARVWPVAGGRRLEAAVGFVKFSAQRRIAEALETGELVGEDTNRRVWRPDDDGDGLPEPDFLSTFRIANLVLAYGRRTGSRPWRLWLESARNHGAADEDTAVLAELECGRARWRPRRARWTPCETRLGGALGWYRIERDAVLSPYAGSDFPGTNVRGARLDLRRALSREADLTVSAIRAEDLGPAGPGGPVSRRRVTVEFGFRF